MLRSTAIFLVVMLLASAPPTLGAKDRREKLLAVETLKPQIILGIEGFFVRPARRTMYVLGSAHSPYFAGWKIVGSGPRRVVVAGDGTKVTRFPDHLQFRITVQAMDNPSLYLTRDLLDVQDDLNHFLLNLHFRLKVFHGLDTTPINPDLVEQIGMPAEIKYDERVYRLTFTLPPVPIEDRLVLEVLRPDDNSRLCKFHLEF